MRRRVGAAARTKRGRNEDEAAHTVGVETVSWPVAPRDVRRLPVSQVPVDALRPGDSPRRGGPDRQHVRALADSEDPLPPIIVNGATMRVIDGMHRLSAAKLRGHGTIDVRFVHCDAMSSFVLAVRANVTHGLPLSLTDRKAAAARILGYYPHWSDRAIAQASGLSANTVAQLRHSLTEPREQLDARVGRDGRVPPLDGAERRAAAARLMREEPGASLRDVARRVGISPETARRVRAQLSGSTGLSSGSSSLSGPTQPSPSEDARLVTRGRGAPYGVIGQQDDLRRLLQSLSTDPAIRSREAGRVLLRALSLSLAIETNSSQLEVSLPEHACSKVARAARACAVAWQQLGHQLELREQTQRSLTGEQSGPRPA